MKLNYCKRFLSDFCRPEKEKNKKRINNNKQIKSHNAEIKSRLRKDNAKQLPSLEVVDNKYIPNLTYFHCMTNKKHGDQYVLFANFIH